MRYMFCVLLHMCATALSLTLLHHIGSDSCCDLCDHTPIPLKIHLAALYLFFLSE